VSRRPPALDTCHRHRAFHRKSAREFSEASAERLLRAFAEEKGVKAGVLINGSRVALTGQAVAPSLFAVMALLGRERVVARLMDAERVLR
jgi:glutamyl-tRNA synthetase